MFLTSNIIFLISQEAKQQNLSETKICERIGISKQLLQRYKKGSEPSATNFYMIAKYFNISMEDLYLKNLSKEKT